jgi:hypothetical protein
VLQTQSARTGRCTNQVEARKGGSSGQRKGALRHVNEKRVQGIRPGESPRNLASTEESGHQTHHQHQLVTIYEYSYNRIDAVRRGDQARTSGQSPCESGIDEHGKTSISITTLIIISRTVTIIISTLFRFYLYDIHPTTIYAYFTINTEKILFTNSTGVRTINTEKILVANSTAVRTITMYDNLLSNSATKRGLRPRYFGDIAPITTSATAINTMLAILLSETYRSWSDHDTGSGLAANYLPFPHNRTQAPRPSQKRLTPFHSARGPNRFHGENAISGGGGGMAAGV